MAIETEFVSLDMRLERRDIQFFIQDLYREGFSPQWDSESASISVASNDCESHAIRFRRAGNFFKLVGGYAFQDEKLSGAFRRLIENAKGHAIVKLFAARHIRVENVRFGETVRAVEISGIEHKVLFEKEYRATPDAIKEAFRSGRVEERIAALRFEIDCELASLFEAGSSGDEEAAAKSKEKLAELRQEMLMCEA